MGDGRWKPSRATRACLQNRVMSASRSDLEPLAPASFRVSEPDPNQLESLAPCLYLVVQLALGAMALSRPCRAALAPVFRAKHFHTGSILAARQSAGSAVAAAPKARRAVPNLEPLEYEEDALADQVREGDDAPEPTHRYLQQQREMLYYLRLIEHEMPKLVGA